MTHPKVLNFDGHHIYNDELAKGFSEHKILGLGPPAHTTVPSTVRQAVHDRIDTHGNTHTHAHAHAHADAHTLPLCWQVLPSTQQADLSARDGGGVARFKAAFRPKMCRQFRAALNKTGKTRGHVSMAEILRIAEMSLVESWDPSLAERMNSTIGYFINADGYLDYDVLRQHRRSDGSSAIPADDVAAAAGSARGDSSSSEAVGSTRSGVRDVRIAAQQKTSAALHTAKKQMEAVGVAVDKQNTPVVTAPQRLLWAGRGRMHPTDTAASSGRTSQSRRRSRRRTR